MPKLLILNKPFHCLSQFSDKQGRATLADIFKNDPQTAIRIKGFYPAGRLDYDSEGLLLLTNDGSLQHRITHPAQKMLKTYWVEVEGEIDLAAQAQLRHGIVLNDGPTLPAKVSCINPLRLWPRQPPVRQRKNIATHWLEISIQEGRNRQVRRMTAAVGLPTLRLIRQSIGHWTLDTLQPGEFRMETINLPAPTKKKSPPKNRKNKPTPRSRA